MQGDDPSGQLQGLMNARDSLHRMSAFAARPKKDKIKEMGKAPYLLDKMLNMSSYALCIKLADRLHNISDMSTMSDEFKHKYSVETNFILNGLKDRKLTKTHMKLISKIKKQLK